MKKLHLKMSSAEVVCCKYLPNITDLSKYRSKQRRPRTDCSYRSSLIWVHTISFRGFLIISADEKSRRLLLRLVKCSGVFAFIPPRAHYKSCNIQEPYMKAPKMLTKSADSCKAARLEMKLDLNYLYKFQH